MTQCVDDGKLRAYLDGALPLAEQTFVATHLGSCSLCDARLHDLRVLAAEVSVALLAPAVPDPAALLRRQIELRSAATKGKRRIDRVIEKGIPMQTPNRWWSGPRRRLVVGLATVVMALALFAMPPVRAAADQLLQVFRVRKIMFVPTNLERFRQLENLDFDGQTLFVAEPRLLNTPAAPQPVASREAAAAAVGFMPHEPVAFPSPPLSSRIVIEDRREAEFQVNVASARQLLQLMGVDDVQLPDALGSEPIRADLPPWVSSHYTGTNYDLTLYQGHTPSVALPDGVDLSQLARAALRLIGMPPADADRLSREVDWSSTFLFPFPADVGEIRQVTVGDTEGLLVGGQGRRSNWQLYWQRGDRFYMLQGEGDMDMEEAVIIAAAASVQ